MNSTKTIILSSLVAFSALACVNNTNIESVFPDKEEPYSHPQNENSVQALEEQPVTSEDLVSSDYDDRGLNSEIYKKPLHEIIMEKDSEYFSRLDRTLLEAGELKYDWDNDGGLPPTQSAIYDARKFLTLLKYPMLISPVPDGSLNISKVVGDNLFDVEIDGTGNVSVFFGADPHVPLLMEVMEINESATAKIQSFISQA